MLDENQIPALDATDEDVTKSEDVVIDPISPTGDVEPTPKSPYQEELDKIEAEKAAIRAELEAEKAEKQRLMDLKDKALAAEKSKTRDMKTTLKEELMAEWRQEQSLNEARKTISSITQDVTAQKVTLHHFENLPASLKTGDVQEDLLTAFALANRKRIASLANAETQNDEGMRRSISSMAGGSSSNSSFETSPSAAARMASRLATAFAGKDKDLAKRLTDRAAQRLQSKSRLR